MRVVGPFVGRCLMNALKIVSEVSLCRPLQSPWLVENEKQSAASEGMYADAK